MARPTIVLSSPTAQAVTFFWRERPECYVGYRFMEHDPEVRPAPLPGIDDSPTCALGDSPEPACEGLLEEPDPWGQEWAASYDEEDPANPIQLRFRAYRDGSAWARGLDNEGRQERSFYFDPVEDGVHAWMTLSSSEPVPGSFAVQQCLRYSGLTNAPWRHVIARVPMLSEYDLQAQHNPSETLTFCRKGGEWLKFPVPWTIYHPTGGAAPVSWESVGEIDHGLIVRESLDGKCASGMYWERTVYVSSRHPADCLHSSVDFGPLEADESRTVHGKVYFVEGSKDLLLDRWRQDFPDQNRDE